LKTKGLYWLPEGGGGLQYTDRRVSKRRIVVKIVDRELDLFLWVVFFFGKKNGVDQSKGLEGTSGFEKEEKDVDAKHRQFFLG